MDTHHATIIGHNPNASAFVVVGHVENPGPGKKSSESASNNLEITLVQKYFKEIGRHLLNADEVHLTGSGTIQEQFIHYLAETPQFKKTITSESTSNPMSDDKLVEFITSHFG